MQIGVETSRMVENMRVFVVDDDDVTRAVLQLILQDEYEAHELGGLTAAYAKGEQGKPDLVLLGLPIIQAGGPALLGDIGARWPGVRVLIVTDPQQAAVAQGHLADGAHGVLSKPFTVEAVRKKVDIQLGWVVPSLVQLQLAPAGAQ